MTTETADSPNGDSDARLRTDIRSYLEGPNTVGNSRKFWISLAAGILILTAYPLGFGAYQASKLTLFLVYSFLGLSLAIVWGYTGILSFGQVAFFGIAGYTFGVVSINYPTPGGITVAFIVAVLGGAAAAFILGYFMFYGEVRDVYVTIITLVTTLVLHTFMAQTAGSEWIIGEAALGGFNGMPAIPMFALGVEGAAITFDDLPFYYFVLLLLVVTYLGLRMLVNSDYGRVLVAVREDEDRTMMFGYNVRRVKLIVFTFSGALAGLSGVLYAAWGNYISPDAFSLAFASLPVVWVSVGGRKTLLGVILATISIEYVSNFLSGQLAFVIVGALLLGVILFLPEGAIPHISDVVMRYRKKQVEKKPGSNATSEVTDQ